MRVIERASELERLTGLNSRAGTGCVLVPTMGALHAGHAALIEHGARSASERGTACVVTIFVNPSQFEEASDFDRYPRTLDDDLALCERAGAGGVFCPAVSEVYPEEEAIETPALPWVATRPGLEDACRPGHFGGVCRVVGRLFDLCRPAAAVFGEKDWQQLQVVRSLSHAREDTIEIIASPTVREASGLAMSRRNVHLSGADLERAAAISRALREALGAESPRGAEALMARTLASAAIEAEYAVVRDARTLLDPEPGEACRALIASRVGSTRLIDNAEWRAGGA